MREPTRFCVAAWEVLFVNGLTWDAPGETSHSAAILQRPAASCENEMFSGARRLVQPEVDFHVDHDGHWLAVLARRFKLPLLDRFDGLLVQSHAQRALNANLLRTSIGADHQPQHDSSLVLGFAGFFRVFRIGRKQRFRRADSAADAIGSPAIAAAVSWTNAWTGAGTNPAAAATADATAVACAIRGRPDHLGQRIAQRANRRQLQIGRAHV